MRTLQCHLCPKSCLIAPGDRGACRIRYNRDGKLVLLTYSRPCAIHIDPIEKKPLFHFSPGGNILSIATAGCNLHCKNCQNWQISQSNPEDVPSYKMGPGDIVSLTREKNCSMIAYTYTEPLAFYEYTLDTSILAKSFGLKNVLVTAGYCNEKPLKKLFRYIDGVNVDLKFFNDAAYRKITSGSLKPVLDTLVLAKETNLWLEITHLVIPTINDNMSDIARMCLWIKKTLGEDVPLHLSRFQPHYLMRNIPATSYQTLQQSYKIAKDAGLEYVYIGNIYGIEEANTYCPNCKNLLIERIGYRVMQNKIEKKHCPYCLEIIAGVWQNSI